MRRFMCWGCGMRGPMQKVLDRVRAGEEDPPCRDCGGILKSDTISFGQQLVPEVIDRAMRVAAEADLFLAVGTHAAGLPGRRRGGHRARGRREDRDRQRPADAVRRRRRRGAARLDQRGAAGWSILGSGFAFADADAARVAASRSARARGSSSDASRPGRTGSRCRAGSAIAEAARPGSAPPPDRTPAGRSRSASR